jgi:TRAP-type C4-dicarboxylate transport system substrate-binding protein
MLKKLLGHALVTASALLVSGAAMAADYNWTFQTSETAGEPGFINKQKWAESVKEMSGGRIEIEILPIGAVVRTLTHSMLSAPASCRAT